MPNKLGRKARNSHKKWTRAEVDYLLDHWGVLSDEWLRRKLGRSQEAMRVRAARMGLGRHDAALTCNQAGRIMGVDMKTVKAWGDRGLLNMRKSPAVMSGRHHCWQISDRDLERFVTEHPEAYDIRRIDRVGYPRLYSLAQKAQKPNGVPRLLRYWTEQEDAFVLNNHATMSEAEIARRLRRTKDAVHARKGLLRDRGHLMPYCKGPWRHRRDTADAIAKRRYEMWSPEQLEYLKENWGRVSLKEIVAVVGHGKNACQQRASRLGLAKGRGYRTDMYGRRESEKAA